MIGQPLLHLRIVASTNDVAKRLAENGCREGTAVLADLQTAGKGRLGRRWVAPAKSGLLVSVVFRPSLARGEVHWLTMMCGLAVLDAVRAETGLLVGLKWPNDLVYQGGKLGGILAESAMVEDRVEHCIVGLGLNVNADPDGLSSLTGGRATSLSWHLGRPVDRMSVLQRLFGALEHRYKALQGGRPPFLEWAAHLSILGRSVTVRGEGRDRCGTAAGVDPDGALLVRLAGGCVERVLADDVVLQEDAVWHRA